MNALPPPGSPVTHRWAVTGDTLEDWECTTVLDLPTPGANTVVIHLGGVTMSSVTVSRDGIEKLLEAAGTGNMCAVPARHPEHGERLLCLRPADEPDEPQWTERPAGMPPYHGPMMLYLYLPDAHAIIIFRREQLVRLIAVLTEILMVENPVAR